MKKSHLVGGFTVLLTTLSIIFLLTWFPSHQTEITNYIKHHPLLAPVIIITWRVIAIVIPPIPGGVLSFALIPVIGWFWSYIYGLIGVMLGASIAFFIARKYREPVVARFMPLQTLHSWEKKLSHKTEFLTFLGVRFTTGPILDFISYIAGLSKISFFKFFLATLIAELPNIVFYYFGAEVYKKFIEKNSYVAMGFLVVLALLLYFIKDHKIFRRGKTDKL